MRKIVIILIFVILSQISFGQKEANVWYFGNGAGLDFNNSGCTPNVLTDGSIKGFEGCATISDKLTGQLLFYTNSERVWNRNHDTIPNAYLVPGGNTITQVLIIRKPMQDSIYYIITSEIQGGGAFGHLGYRFHCIDMKLNGGYGGLVFKDSILWDSTVTEKITAVFHANGTDIWVIGHQYHSDKYLAFLVTASGINTIPVITSIGKLHFDLSSVDPLGELKASPDRSKLAAVTPFHPHIELFDFNNSTGQLSNLITLPELGGYGNLSNGSGLYGVSFSANSSKLFATQTGNGFLNITSKIIQYDITSNDSATITNSRINIHSTPFNIFYSLKLAPDRKIYVGHPMSPYIGVISNPDTTGLYCNYIDSGIYLNGKESSWGLNNLMEYNHYRPNIID